MRKKVNPLTEVLEVLKDLTKLSDLAIQSAIQDFHRDMIKRQVTKILSKYVITRKLITRKRINRVIKNVTSHELNERP